MGGAALARGRAKDGNALSRFAASSSRRGSTAARFPISTVAWSLRLSASGRKPVSPTRPSSAISARCRA